MIRVKLLDAIVFFVTNVNVACAVHSYALRHVKQAVSSTRAAPFCYEHTVRVEFLYAVIFSICYVDVPGTIDGDTRGSVELTISIAEASPLGFEYPTDVELLDTIIAVIREVHEPPDTIDGYALRVVELAIP